MSESPESKYRRYIEQRQDYARIASEHLTRFERSVLVASGAGIAAVFSLISSENPIKSWPIALAAILFGASFGSMLFSHYLSYVDNEQAIKKLDAEFDNENQPNSERNWFSHCIEPLNWASLSAMIIGYISFGISLMNGN